MCSNCRGTSAQPTESRECGLNRCTISRFAFRHSASHSAALERLQLRPLRRPPALPCAGSAARTWRSRRAAPLPDRRCRCRPSWPARTADRRSPRPARLARGCLGCRAPRPTSRSSSSTLSRTCDGLLPVETDARGAPAELRRARQRRQRPRHIRQRTVIRRGACRRGRARSRAFCSSHTRDSRPHRPRAAASANTCGWRRTSLSRMPLATAAKSNQPCSSRHARMEHHLEQQIAELVAQLRRIAALDRHRRPRRPPRWCRARWCAKVCSRSQGQPRCGSRSRAIRASSASSAAAGAPPCARGSALDAAVDTASAACRRSRPRCCARRRGCRRPRPPHRRAKPSGARER